MLYYQYSMGMQSIEELWDIGYRAENLDIKLNYLQSQYQQIEFNIDEIMKIQQLNNPILRGISSEEDKNQKFFKRKLIKNILTNIYSTGDQQNKTVELWCEDINQLIRIGANDFRTDERDSCLLYSGDVTVSIQGPETMFDLIDLGDESFGLRSLTNGKFVQVVPPGSGDSFDPWKVSLGGYIPGAPEKFRLSPEGHLYSGLMGGISFNFSLIFSIRWIFIMLSQ